MSKIGIILGSGLSRFKNELTGSKVVYSEVGGIHKKEIIEGKISGKSIVLFTGRNHFYETNNQEKVFRNINMAKEYNVDFLIITNAAGGLNPHFKISDLMLIRSHINFFQIPFAKKRTQCFDVNLLNFAKQTAVKHSLKTHVGNYYASAGPVYETQAEINFIRKAGADAVGMSTIPDIVKANELGIKTLGISCITNLLYYGLNIKVTHDEVVAAGNNAYKVFTNFLKVLINDY